MAAEITLVNLRSSKKWEDFKCPDKLTCNVCGDEKPKEEFALCRTNKTGRRGKCRVCDAKRVAENEAAKQIDKTKFFTW